MRKPIRNTPKTEKTPKVEAPPITPEQLIEECGSKSAAIRKLNAEGKSRSDIADFLGIRYQHVRNVLLMPLTKETATEEQK